MPSDKQLKVAMIYSFGVNNEDYDALDDENTEDTTGLDKNS